MLLGTVIGDAAGGPVEFRNPDEIRDVMPALRSWDEDRRLTADDLAELASTFRLHSYEKLRPQPAPYGQWTINARPGTVTDDTRHKIILLNALRDAQGRSGFPLSRRDLARAYVAYADTPAMQRRRDYARLCEEGHREFVKSARWVLGRRDVPLSLPPERQWSGVASCAGQMALLPLAALFPAAPEEAYRATYDLNFLDNGPAKDINAAIVAGLVRALVVDVDPARPEAAWDEIVGVMKRTDPFEYAKVPFVGRVLNRWLDFAADAAERADGKPRRLYEILEREGEARYYWDAHFTLTAALAILRLCRYQPLAALHMTLDFGHDTDSVAQLLGAFVGAAHGPEAFPRQMRATVIRRLRADYTQSLAEWVELLESLSDRERYPLLVRSE